MKGCYLGRKCTARLSRIIQFFMSAESMEHMKKLKSDSYRLLESSVPRTEVGLRQVLDWNLTSSGVRFPSFESQVCLLSRCVCNTGKLLIVIANICLNGNKLLFLMHLLCANHSIINIPCIFSLNPHNTMSYSTSLAILQTGNLDF